MKTRILKRCTMRNTKFRDSVFGFCTLIFFLTLTLLTETQGGFANHQAQTSGATSMTYPYIIGTAGIIISLALIIERFSAIVKECRNETEEPSNKPKTEKGLIRWKMVFSCIAMMFALNILLVNLGVVLGGFIYLLVQIFILSEKKTLTKKNILIAVIVSICVPLLIYFPFTYIFKAKIPMGIFR